MSLDCLLVIAIILQVCKRFGYLYGLDLEIHSEICEDKTGSH